MCVRRSSGAVFTAPGCAGTRLQVAHAKIGVGDVQVFGLALVHRLQLGSTGFSRCRGVCGSGALPSLPLSCSAESRPHRPRAIISGVRAAAGTGFLARSCRTRLADVAGKWKAFAGVLLAGRCGGGAGRIGRIRHSAQIWRTCARGWRIQRRRRMTSPGRKLLRRAGLGGSPRLAAAWPQVCGATEHGAGPTAGGSADRGRRGSAPGTPAAHHSAHAPATTITPGMYSASPSSSSSILDASPRVCVSAGHPANSTSQILVPGVCYSRPIMLLSSLSFVPHPSTRPAATPRAIRKGVRLCGV